MKALEEYGVTLEPRGRGKHYKLSRDGARCYTITAHNGLKSEISDHYIRGACKNFGIEPSELKKKL